ncbi:esterase family protein [Mucilaginibacter antarcticus]|uniref:Esterase family protein n=1 Tax=Mucilaginibacter antarcticus TaxID=1855725 RepID=A0ABW5XMB8_9SPHI
MELLIFGHAGQAVLFFPPRVGRFYDYENWGTVYALSDRINAGEIQLFCVDSIDEETFYNNWAEPQGRMERHLQYERYILQEVLPFIKTKNDSIEIEAAGCSMGAYHAANIALRSPQLFNKIVCMSGRYDLTQPVTHFKDLLDGYRSEIVYLNMPRQYMTNLEDEELLAEIRKIKIVLVIGQTDPFFDDNYAFSETLGWKGMQHEFHIWGGYAHSARSWNRMVHLYL